MVGLVCVMLTAGCGAGLVVPMPVTSEPGQAKVFPVTSFGARGDGTTDDAPAIQRAIDAATAVGGGRVTLPCGEFSLQSAAGAAPSARSILYSKKSTGVELAGEGSCSHLFTSLRQKTVLEFDAATLPIVTGLRITAPNTTYVETFGMDGGSAVRFTGVDRGTISHVEVDGATAGALYITAGTSHSSVNNNNVHDTYGSGIWEDNCGGESATDCSPYRTPTNNIYELNTLTNTSLAMPTAMTTDNGGLSSMTTIRDNTISWTRSLASNPGVHCLQVGNSADVTVSNNTCTGAPYDGIVITASNQTASTRISILSNTIISAGTGANGGSGIVAYNDRTGGGISNVTLAYNNITLASNDGIRLATGAAPGGVHDVQIVNNAISMVDQQHPGTRFGVDVELADKVTVAGNTITGDGRCIAAGVNVVSTTGTPPLASANTVIDILGQPLALR